MPLFRRSGNVGSNGTQDLVDERLSSGIAVVIPPKNAGAPRTYDVWRYREWQLIGSFRASTD